MTVDKIVEAFQATMIIAVLGVVALSIWAPNVGDIAMDILPGFLKIVIYFFLILAIIGAVIEELP